ncbi:hypothetical protein XENORESO_003695 [Xenotaenia resolanae]|uniref:Secreted protein n=1 Tax=Xenotaenia resolanae TaxID=208358 RepID=A0ABV0VNP2_9TELE
MIPQLLQPVLVFKVVFLILSAPHIIVEEFQFTLFNNIVSLLEESSLGQVLVVRQRISCLTLQDFGIQTRSWFTLMTEWWSGPVATKQAQIITHHPLLCLTVATVCCVARLC